MPSVFLSRPLALSLALSAALGFAGPAQADFLYGRLVPQGTEPDGDSSEAGVSIDGRTVVFSSGASNWVTSSYNGDKAIAVDLDTGIVEIVSATPTGTVFRGESPVVSSDGRYVAFLSYGSTALGPSWQVGRKDRQTGALETASSDASNQPASQGTNDEYVAISADGRYIVFDTASPNLIPAGAGMQIFVKDMQTGAVEMASVRADGSPSGSGAQQKNAARNASAKSGDSTNGGGTCSFTSHALSADGRYVAMTCGTAMVPGASGGQAYVRDLQTNTTELISRSASAASGSSAFAYRVAISPNGRFVTFQNRSYGGLGYADGANAASNSGVYLRDRQAQATVAIPRPAVISADDYDSCSVSAISSIGTVLLQCRVNVGGTRIAQAFLYVPGQGAEMLSIGAGNQPGNAASGDSLAVNASGLSMAWESVASNIDPNDHNGKRDIFVLVDESVITDKIFADGFEVAPARQQAPAGRVQSMPVVPGSRAGAVSRD